MDRVQRNGKRRAQRNIREPPPKVQALSFTAISRAGSRSSVASKKAVNTVNDGLTNQPQKPQQRPRGRQENSIKLEHKSEYRQNRAKLQGENYTTMVSNALTFSASMTTNNIENRLSQSNKEREKPQTVVGDESINPTARYAANPVGGDTLDLSDSEGKILSHSVSVAASSLHESDRIGSQLRMQVESLRRQLQDKDAELFMAKAVVAADKAEDEHRNSEKIKALKSKLAFYEKDVLDARAHVSKVQREVGLQKAKLERKMQAAQHRIRELETALQSKSTLHGSATTPETSQGFHSLKRTNDLNLSNSVKDDNEGPGKSVKIFAPWESIKYGLKGMHPDILKVIREAEEPLATKLFSELLEDETVVIHKETAAVKWAEVVDALIILLPKSESAGKVLKNLLIVSPGPLTLCDSKVQELLALVLDESEPEPISEAIQKTTLDILMLISQRPCALASPLKKMLETIQGSFSRCSNKLMDLYAQLLSQIFQLEPDFPIPKCVSWFKEHPRLVDGIVRVCCTIIASCGNRGVEELCQQGAVQEILHVLNLVATTAVVHEMSTIQQRQRKLRVQVAVRLLLSLLTCGLEKGFDGKWRLQDIVYVLFRMIKIFPDLNSEIHQLLEQLLLRTRALQES